MPDPGANLHVIEWLSRSTFTGRIIAIAGYDDEAEQMRARGVDIVINMYDGLGSSLAEAVEALDPVPVSRTPVSSAAPAPETS